MITDWNIPQTTFAMITEIIGKSTAVKLDFPVCKHYRENSQIISSWVFTDLLPTLMFVELIS